MTMQISHNMYRKYIKA